VNVKKTIRIIHLWLGLISGPIVLFLGLTGCILAFQKEIENATQPYRFIQSENKSFLPPSKLRDIGYEQLPGKLMHAVLYQGTDHAAQVIFYSFEPEEYYYIVYVNPFSGEVLKVKDMDRDFFRQVVLGHYYLWLPPNIGQPIVASATLVFVVMMVSGLILWWPRNRASTKQRFTIKWNARWRRRNYDLHYVLGFYMTWVAIILAATGLMWGFQWFEDAVYKVAGGNKSLEYIEPVSDTTKTFTTGTEAIDIVWQDLQRKNPHAEILEVHIPATASSPIAANTNPDASTYWKTDYVYYDQHTLKELSVTNLYGRYNEASTADKLVRMNYDIHTGAIWGLPGKILMFFASLIASSLPVTGLYIWLGRKKKRKRTIVSVPAMRAAVLSQ
jgi:uncharacterized iron-regulated membrane protein